MKGPVNINAKSTPTSWSEDHWKTLLASTIGSLIIVGILTAHPARRAQVRGEVVTASVIPVTIEHRLEGQTTHYSTEYRVHVEFMYEVSGNKYRSDRYCDTGDNNFVDDATAAHNFANGLTPGSVVNVHYDKENPSNAVMSMPPRWYYYLLYYLLAGCALGFFKSTIMLGRAAVRRWRSGSQ